MSKREWAWTLAMLACCTMQASESYAQRRALRASDLATEGAASQEFSRRRGRIVPTQVDQGMVGPSAENVRRTFQELLGTERRQRNQDMSIENLNERRRSRRRQQGQRNPPPPVHVQFRPTFNFQKLQASQVATNVQLRLNQVLTARETGNIQVEMNQRTATLSGAVRSEYERALLEKLVAIEPGVSEVENLITVEEILAEPFLGQPQ